MGGGGGGNGEGGGGGGGGRGGGDEEKEGGGRERMEEEEGMEGEVGEEGNEGNGGKRGGRGRRQWEELCLQHTVVCGCTEYFVDRRQHWICEQMCFSGIPRLLLKHTCMIHGTLESYTS